MRSWKTESEQNAEPLFSFINDLTEFNERCASFVPVIKQDLSADTIEFTLTEKNGSTSRRRSSKQATKPVLQDPDYSTDSEVFELDMTDSPSRYSSPKPLPTPSPKSNGILGNTSSGWQVVAARKPSFPTGARPSANLFSSPAPQTGSSIPGSSSSYSKSVSAISDTTQVNASPQTSDALFPKLGEWNTPRRPSVNKGSPWTRNSISSEPPTPSSPVTPTASGLSKAMKKLDIKSPDSSLSPSQSNGETLSSIIESKAKTIRTSKLSQRERRKLQESEEANPVSVLSKSPPVIAGSSNPWKSIQQPKKQAPSSAASHLDDPFAAYTTKVPVGNGSVKQAAQISNLDVSPMGSLSQIIQQEHRQVEIRAAERSKSIKEIQQEEEFARWWAEESAKVQAEQQLIQDLANPQKGKIKNHKNHNGKDNCIHDHTNKSGSGKKKQKNPRGDLLDALANAHQQPQATNENANKRNEGSNRGRGGGNRGRGRPKGKGKPNSEDIKA